MPNDFLEIARGQCPNPCPKCNSTEKFSGPLYIKEDDILRFWCPVCGFEFGRPPADFVISSTVDEIFPGPAAGKPLGLFQEKK